MRVKATINNYYKRSTGATEHEAWSLTNDVWTTRIRRRMTQQQLAKKLGVSRQTISRIERGHHEPTVSLAITIAETLEVSVEQLFSVRPKPAAPWRPNPWQTTAQDTARLQQRRLQLF
jgi:putative transcriptional regulator